MTSPDTSPLNSEVSPVGVEEGRKAAEEELWLGRREDSEVRVGEEEAQEVVMRSAGFGKVLYVEPRDVYLSQSHKKYC